MHTEMVFRLEFDNESDRATERCKKSQVISMIMKMLRPFYSPIRSQLNFSASCITFDDPCVDKYFLHAVV